MLNMKTKTKTAIKTIATTAALSLFSVGVFAMPSINKAAPEFTAIDSNGKKVSLKDFTGKKVILEWTNNECPFVVKHYGSDNMQSLQKKYPDEEVVWLSVISSAEGKQGYVDGKGANKLTKDRKAAPDHVLLDPEGKIGKMYGAKTTPHMYIVDEKGDLKYMGAIDSIRSTDPADIPKSTNYVTQAMIELASGKAVSEPVTQAYGCSVKYK